MESVLTRKVAFTPASLDALSQGSLKDPLTPGLSVEVLPSGKKAWKYTRRVSGSGSRVRLSLGLFPVHSIADARKWAAGLNDEVELGVDPREALRIAEERTGMTVGKAHELYMTAVREGRASRTKRKNKPRTIADKLEIYNRDIAPKLARKSIYEVTERDLINLITSKGKAAKVRANRLAAELKVFFGWAAGLRGLVVGLEIDPARRLGDLRFPESPRQRILSLEEIEWFLKAVAQEEERDFRRGMVLWLLTAARISELIHARADEIVEGTWTVPSERSKNRRPHTVKLGPWRQDLMATNSQWVFPAPKIDGPRKTGWYKARDRVLARMFDGARLLVIA